MINREALINDLSLTLIAPYFKDSYAVFGRVYKYESITDLIIRASKESGVPIDFFLPKKITEDAVSLLEKRLSTKIFNELWNRFPEAIHWEITRMVHKDQAIGLQKHEKAYKLLVELGVVNYSTPDFFCESFEKDIKFLKNKLFPDHK